VAFETANLAAITDTLECFGYLLQENQQMAASLDKAKCVCCMCILECEILSLVSQTIIYFVSKKIPKHFQLQLDEGLSDFNSFW